MSDSSSSLAAWSDAWLLSAELNSDRASNLVVVDWQGGGWLLRGRLESVRQASLGIWCGKLLGLQLQQADPATLTVHLCSCCG